MNKPETTCAAHDPSLTRPAVSVPPLACDVHAHVCGPNDRYPLIAARLYTPPEASPDDYRQMLAALGVTRGVLVQPSINGVDNRAMLDANARDPKRLCGVAALPFDVPVAEIERLHAAGVRGVRCNIVDLKRHFSLNAARCRIRLLRQGCPRRQIPRYASRIRASSSRSADAPCNTT